jgi:poly(3-hydroxybutyrate) depolymerase
MPSMSDRRTSEDPSRVVRAGRKRPFGHGIVVVMACWLLSACTEPDVAPRSALTISDLGSDLVGRTAISAVEERIRVRGDGREIPAIVLLPDDYGAREHYPLVLAIHNFGGGPRRIAGMMEAERLRKAGNIVVLPQAAGLLLLDWQGPGIALALARQGEDGQPVNDIVGLTKLFAVVRNLYRIDARNVNLAGFSQGATLAFELARQLELQRSGSVRRLFAVAGSVRAIEEEGSWLPQTDIIHYEPGRNTLQRLANWRTGEPPEADFIPAIIAAKGCSLHEQILVDGVDTQVYACRDGRSVTRIYEQDGEHAWPGQPAEYDIWLLGSGSISRLKFTDLMIREIASPDVQSVARR